MTPLRHPLDATAVGLGFRPEIAGDLLGSPGSVDFVEVVAEACFASPAAYREAVAVSRVWPVVPHGVKLSLGSAEGVDLDRARRLGSLAREVGAEVVTEHVAFVRAGGREIGHLTPVPLTREMVRIVARNVARARALLPDVPLHLENPAWTFRWPGDELDEASFYGEIVAQTGCSLLLDLGNLHANAVNAGADPFAVLDAYPLDRVAMVHVAGGAHEHGFYFDTHAHPVPDAVFALLARLLDRIGPVPVVLERDDGFPPFAELAGEVARVRGMVSEAPARPRRARPEGNRAVAGEAPHAALAASQARVARMLTDLEAPAPEAAMPFGEGAIARSRAVLQSKRVDDALPLLQRLVPHRDALRPLAVACVEGSPRAPSLAGVADAVRIAGAAAEDPRLAAAAKVDLLLLRSRFVGPAKDGSLRPRVAPFVGRERLAGGRAVWVVKGPGSSADVRIYETRR
jgi:uncharacterized protein (UPF0276 family)